MYKELQSERLILNHFNKGDIKDVAKLSNDKDMFEMTASLPYPYLEDHAKEWISTHDEQIATGKNFIFAIRLLESNSLIGCINISINNFNNRGYIGYWIGKKFWNMGYGTEALKRIISYGFEDLKLERIWAEYYAHNTPSGKIMKKAGMIDEGIKRNHIKKDNEYIDLKVSAIIKSDYFKTNKKT